MQTKSNAEIYAEMSDDIFVYVWHTWKLEPQPIKKEYREKFDIGYALHGKAWSDFCKTISPEWFEEFVEGEMLTWQQSLICHGINKALRGEVPARISIVSGHGIGKSAIVAIVVCWFLWVHPKSKMGCTAPSADQMYDVLWSEIKKWIEKMPMAMAAKYEWQTTHIMMKEAPNEWFARAKTSSKENTEALAGLHADWVGLVADEASGIEEAIFQTMEGALTSGNVLILLISNGTRVIGYFFDTHHKDANNWQNYSFNSEQSPIVDHKFVEGIIQKYGRDSDEFKIRVGGGFPGEDAMDLSGYLQLISREKIQVRLKEKSIIPFIGRKILGVDPSGEGKDRATYVIRDRFKAEKVFERRITSDKQIAEDILTLMTEHDIHPSDVVVGAFGTGANVGKEIAISTSNMKGGAYDIYTVMEGNSPEAEEEYNWKFFERHPDELQNPESNPSQIVDMFLNIRALMYFRAMKWLVAGGQIVDTSRENSDFVEELTMIRYKRSLHGNKIQLMPKKEMLKLRIKSPNIGDAFALTFLRDLNETTGKTAHEQAVEDREEENVGDDDRFGAI